MSEIINTSKHCISKKYRRKPIEVEAIQWDGSEECLAELIRLEGAYVELNCPYGSIKQLNIYTKQGRVIAEIGDWIVRSLFDGMYCVKNHIFALTYENCDDNK